MALMTSFKNSKSILYVLFLSIVLFSLSTSSVAKKTLQREPCRRMVFYFHDILYNGKNAKNATSAIIGSPAGANKTTLAGQDHFGNLVVFDDPITLDGNLHSAPVGRAQGMYFYDRKDVFTAWLGFSFVFNSTEHKGSLTFAGADPLMSRTRDISVIGAIRRHRRFLHG